MSVCDRLRTQDIRATMTASPSSASSCDTETWGYESSDARRTNTALAELRSCCRTDQALQSFEIFEANLRKNTRIPAPYSRSRESDGGSDVSDEDAGRTLQARVKTQQASPLRPTPITARRISRIPTPVKIELPLPNIFSRLTLTKSKTTSNLATLSSVSIKNTSTPKLSLPSASQSSGVKTDNSDQQRGPKSGTQVASKSGVTLKEQGQRIEQRAADIRRRVSERTISLASTNSGQSGSHVELAPSKLVKKNRLVHSKTSTSLPIPDRRSSYPTVGDDHNFIAGTNCRALEAGQGPPPRARSPWGAQVDNVNAHRRVKSGWDGKSTTIGAERVIRSKSRKRSQRQSSGEVVKNMFDAGVSQVMKMGRRVGGSMSWAGSAEDLNGTIGGRGNEK